MSFINFSFMRCFFAVELPERVKRSVKSFMNEYKKIDFVKLANLHLTLKFMGSVDNVKELVKCVSSVEQESFYMNLKNVGAFPNKQYVRILWLGVGKGRGKLIDLSDEIEELTSSFRTREREFFPHITIARCKNGVDKSVFNHDFESSCFRVDEFVLMKSVFKPLGVEYSVVERFSLI